MLSALRGAGIFIRRNWWMSFVQLGKDKGVDQKIFRDVDYESRLTAKDFFDSKIERSIEQEFAAKRRTHITRNMQDYINKTQDWYFRKS
jgi:hypothetical protein